jgi:hypothetical protein
LSKLALDVLSILAMLAEPERLFLATKLILTDRRNKLSIRIIKALACLKSWYKLRDFIPEDDLFIRPKVKEDK